MTPPSSGVQGRVESDSLFVNLYGIAPLPVRKGGGAVLQVILRYTDSGGISPSERMSSSLVYLTKKIR